MRKNTALILIDIQKGFEDQAYWGNDRNNPEAESKASQILSHWRRLGLPVFHIKHDSTNPGSKLAPGQPGNEIMEIVKPLAGEPVIAKHVNSAFIGTDLKDRLDKQKIRSVAFVGLTTDHCVSTSVRMAANLGFETFVVSDATATFGKTTRDGKKIPAQQMHDINLASLDNEFATVLTTDQLLKML